MSDCTVGDIVQISPGHDWAGVLLVVEEIRSWGVLGYCAVPTKGLAYVRVEFKHITPVGRAAWLHEGDEQRLVATSPKSAEPSQ